MIFFTAGGFEGRQARTTGEEAFRLSTQRSAQMPLRWTCCLALFGPGNIYFRSSTIGLQTAPLPSTTTIPAGILLPLPPPLPPPPLLPLIHIFPSYSSTFFHLLVSLISYHRINTNTLDVLFVGSFGQTRGWSRGFEGGTSV